MSNKIRPPRIASRRPRAVPWSARFAVRDVSSQSEGGLGMSVDRIGQLPAQ
jgi:hypothetical protein